MSKDFSNKVEMTGKRIKAKKPYQVLKLNRAFIHKQQL